jgi:predicted NBD/HSP70 family sugar kinase
MHADEIVRRIAQEIELASAGKKVEAVGVGFPGINRNGLIEESPNLKQTKGLDLREALTQLLNQKNISAPVLIMNDADALSARMPRPAANSTSWLGSGFWELASAWDAIPISRASARADTQ